MANELEEEEEKKGGGGHDNRLAYGLLIGAGVDVNGLSPSEAWELVSQLMQGSLLGRNGLVGVGDGDVWFGLTEDGTIRLFTLQTPNGWSVRPEQTGVTAS